MKYGFVVWVCLLSFFLVAAEGDRLLPLSVQEGSTLATRVISLREKAGKFARKTCKATELTLRMGALFGCYYGFTLGTTYITNTIENPTNQAAAATAVGSISTVVAMTALWPVTSALYPAVYWILGRSKSGVIFSIDWLQKSYYTRAQLDASAQEMLDPLILQYTNMLQHLSVGLQLIELQKPSEEKKVPFLSNQIYLLVSDFLDNQSFEPDHGTISDHAALVIGGLSLKLGVELTEDTISLLQSAVLEKSKQRNQTHRYPRADWEKTSHSALQLWFHAAGVWRETYKN